MKIWTDQLKFDVYAQVCPESFKQYLLERIKTSDTMDDDSRAYLDSLYFVAKEFIWFFQPAAPAYRVKINFSKTRESNGRIASISVKGNVVLVGFKYLLLLFGLILELVPVLLMSVPYEITIDNLVYWLMALVMSVFFQSVNQKEIKKGSEHIKALIDSGKYEIRDRL